MALSEDKLSKIHADARIEFNAIQSAQKDERQQCLDDRRFYSIAGAQWEGKLGEQFENKPKFEVNKIHLAVIRIINEYRNNRITVDFISKDGAKDDELADVCDGLYRADELDSSADEAYDNAFEEGVGGGFGAWRLRAEYEDEDDDENEQQRIRIEPIYDADSCVFFDLGAKRQDKSDAKKCYVLSSMSVDAYIEEYDDDPTSWPKEVDSTEFDWSTPDVVYTAELYCVERNKETVHIYKTLDGEELRYTDSDFKNDDELLPMLEATAAKKLREKKVTRQRVHKYIMSGGGILEDCGYVAGKYIPIIPYYGKRWFVDNVERCMGHVRLAKDVQRLKNMQLSKLGEISGQSTIEKPILSPEQIAGHENMWAEDNIKDYPYLLINPTTDANDNPVAIAPTAYTKPPQIPPALAALLQITEQDISDLLGNQQAGEEITSNISSETVELIQTRLDMQTFIYMSNMAKAVKRSGEVWLEMARDLLVERNRKMKVVGKQGEIDNIILGEPKLADDGSTEYSNDLTKARHDVTASVGPSSSSKRSATVRALTGMMRITTDPETAQVLSSMVMMNMEGEGIEDVRDFFRQKLIKMGVVKPTKQEAADLMEALQNQPKDPNAEYLEAAAGAEEARAAKARADSVLALAKSEETQAKTMETLAGIDRDDQEAVLKLAEALRDAVQPEPAQPVQQGENVSEEL